MKVFHKAFKKIVNISALADARQVLNACADTVAETNKMLSGVKALAYAGHKGVDAWHNWGSQIYATHAGIVSWSRDEGNLGGGVWLEITRTGKYSAQNELQDGEQYKHFRRGSVVVAQGHKVVEGQLLGIQGTTGNSTGEHLHYEVIRKGKRVDPLPYLLGTEKEEMNHLEKLLVYNYNSNKPIMITAEALIFEGDAKQRVVDIVKILPELKPFAGVRTSPTSSAGKYQVVLARYNGKMEDAKEYAKYVEDKINLPNAPVRVKVTAWAW